MDTLAPPSPPSDPRSRGVTSGRFEVPRTWCSRPLVALVLALTSGWLGATVVSAAPPEEVTADSATETATQRRQLAMTFDDLPAVPMRSLAYARQVTDNLLAGLARHRIPAMGLANSGKLEHGDEYEARLELLRRWLEDGHLLGNHTANHPSIDAVGADGFQADIVAGEPALQDLLAERGQTLRYFRHPYLRTGRRAEDRQQVDEFLAARGYTIVPVTLENNDWLFAAVYQWALNEGDTETAERVAEAYLDHTDELLEFLESVSNRYFGREIPHILLLHANRLNADHLDGLVKRLTDRGYDFIDVPSALEDPAYRSADTFIGPQGVHWLYRWVVSGDPVVAKQFTWSEEPQATDWVAARYRERTR